MGAHARLVELLHHSLLLLLQLRQFMLVVRVHGVLLLHAIRIALLDVVPVLDLKFGFSLRRFLLRFAHLHRGDHLLGTELSLFLLKISLLLGNDVLRKPNIRTLLALKIHSRSHLAICAILPGALDSLHSFLLNLSVSLVQSLPIGRLFLLVSQCLLLVSSFSVRLLFFLLHLLDIPLQGVDPVLQLLHVLLGLLHVALLFHHKLRLKLGLLSHRLVQGLLVCAETVIELVLLESSVPHIAERFVCAHASTLRHGLGGARLRNHIGLFGLL